MKNSTINNRRYEYKAVLPLHFLESVSSFVKSHPMGLYEAYPERKINNIYFDTRFMDCYNDNLAGKGRRYKFRIRWYGNNLQKIQKGILEVKNKEENLGWKVYHKLSQDLDLTANAWPEIIKRLESSYHKDDFQLAYFFSNPILINSYDRRYYETFDRTCRLTLDFNLKYFDQSKSLKPNTTFETHSHYPLIVEFKSTLQNKKLLKDLSQSFPFSVDHFSKYVNAVELIET